VNENTNTTLSDSVLQGRQQQQRMQQKLEVYNEILRRLQESNHEEANLPGFDDQLWTHFNSLPTRYVRACVRVLVSAHVRVSIRYMCMYVTWCCLCVTEMKILCFFF
jgi:hypothetical protein